MLHTSLVVHAAIPSQLPGVVCALASSLPLEDRANEPGPQAALSDRTRCVRHSPGKMALPSSKNGSVSPGNRQSPTGSCATKPRVTWNLSAPTGQFHSIRMVPGGERAHPKAPRSLSTTAPEFELYRWFATADIDLYASVRLSGLAGPLSRYAIEEVTVGAVALRGTIGTYLSP